MTAIQILQELDRRGLAVMVMRYSGEGANRWGVRIGLAEWREGDTHDEALVAAWDRYDAEMGASIGEQA